MSSRRTGRRAENALVERTLDVSWIRIYVLLRATSQPISSAEVAADLVQLGFKHDPLSTARIIKGLEGKGYLTRTVSGDERRPIVYSATANGRAASKMLRRTLREFFPRTHPANPSAG
jgi:hypothetical protein